MADRPTVAPTRGPDPVPSDPAGPESAAPESGGPESGGTESGAPESGAPEGGALDDAALAASDRGGMLAAVASAGDQVRAALADWDATADGRHGPGGAEPAPRAVVVAGMGGSAAAGDVLAAFGGASDGCTPILVHRGYGVPGWLTHEDLVIAVSCSGGTAETVDALRCALERGARVRTIGGADSELAAAAAAANLSHLVVDSAGRAPRASLWALTTPLLLVAEQFGVAPGARAALDSVPTALDGVAAVSGPGIGRATNRAKQLALHLADGLPLVWGCPGLGAAAAGRFAAQIAENAKRCAVVGALSEVHHNQVVAFDGPAARDLRLVLLADAAEPVTAERRLAESIRAAQDAEVPAVTIRGAGPDRLSRLAGMTALLDFASVYLALYAGVDPTPVRPIDALKARMAAADGGAEGR